MPTVDLYNGTTYLEEHLGVYKAQMYVQDVGHLLPLFSCYLKRGGAVMV